MAAQLPEHPREPEVVYSDFDEECGWWAVFGLDSGFCYGTFPGKSAAEDLEKEMNGEKE
jgi:hypothetical protein